MTMQGKTYWLVGASEGLGRELAVEMDRAGVKLILSARSEERLTALNETLSQDAIVAPLDVTDRNQVSDVFTSIGHVDGVVYLAGAYNPMRTQDWDVKTAEQMAQVNFMGALHVLGHVAPGFAARNSGHIVLIGSLAGYRGLPGAIGYGASKAAMMHLAETMQSDLWHTDVKVQLINPGFIKTRLTDKNEFEMPFLLLPAEAAQKVMRAMRGNRFKTDFPWVFSMVFRLGRFLPQPLYQRLFAPRPNTAKQNQDP